MSNTIDSNLDRYGCTDPADKEIRTYIDVVQAMIAQLKTVRQHAVDLLFREFKEHWEVENEPDE